MSSEREISIIQKATMYDLIQVLEKNPDKVYTVEELKALISAYLSGAENK